MTRPVMGLSSMDSAGLDNGMDMGARLDLAQSASQAGGVAFDAAAVRPKAGDGVGIDPGQIAQLRKVSQDFESVFLSYMMKVGRDTTSKGTFWGHTQGEEIFTEMRDDELAKNMAKAGGIGLANLLVEQLTRTLQQEARRQADAGARGQGQRDRRLAGLVERVLTRSFVEEPVVPHWKLVVGRRGDYQVRA